VKCAAMSSAEPVLASPDAAPRAPLPPERLRELHRSLLFPRVIEEKMLLVLRQGRLSKWFSGMGQEAIAVGVTSALKPDDWILPMHRNLGVFTTRVWAGPTLNRPALTLIAAELSRSVLSRSVPALTLVAPV